MNKILCALAVLFGLVSLVHGRTNEWRKADVSGVPPLEKEGHSCEVLGRKMYVYGGRSSITAWHNSLHVLDLDAQSWSEIKLPTTAPKLTLQSMTAIGGKIYIFGGRSSVFSYSNKLYAFDITTEAVTEVATTGEAPSERYGHSGVAVNGQLYIYGGFNGKDRLDDMFVFDPESAIWTKVDYAGTGPGKVDGHQVVAVREKFFLFGGVDGNKNFVDQVYSFDTVTNRWSTVAKAKGRASHSATLLHDRFVYVFGGLDISKARLSDVKVFDVDTNKWVDTTISGDISIPARQGHCAVPHDSKVYVFGGSVSWTTYFNDLFVLDTTPELTKKQRAKEFGDIPLSERIERATDNAKLRLKMIRDTDSDAHVAIEVQYEEDITGPETIEFPGLSDKIAIWNNIAELYSQLLSGKGGVSSMTAQNLHLRVANITSLKKERNEVRTVLEAQIKDIEENMDNLKNLEDKLRENAQRRTEVEKMHSMAGDSVKSHEAQYDELLRQQRSLELDVQRYEQRKHTLQSTMDRLLALESQMTATYDEYQKQEESLIDELNKVRRKLSDASDEQQKLHNTHNSLSKNITGIDRELTKLKDLEEDIMATKAKLKASKEAFSDYLLSKLALVAKVRRFLEGGPEDKHDNLDVDESWLDNILAAHRRTLSVKLASQKQEIDRVEIELKKKTEIVEELKREEDRIQKQLTKIKTKLATRNEETDKRVRERQVTEKEYRDAVTKYDEVALKKSAVADDIDQKKKDLERAKADAQAELEKLLKTKEEEDKAKRELEKVNMGLEHEYDQIVSTSDRLKRLEEAIAVIRTEISSVEYEYDTYKQSMEDLRKKIAKEVERAEAELRQRVRDLELEVANLKRTIEDKKNC